MKPQELYKEIDIKEFSDTEKKELKFTYWDMMGFASAYLSKRYDSVYDKGFKEGFKQGLTDDDN